MDSFNVEPKKSLGQNFIHDPNALEKIVATAEISPQDTILEIGPGTGALTVHLAQTAARVLAVEIDNRLLPILRHQLSDFPNVEVIHADILEIPITSLVADQPFIVVANLPYYITSAILRHVLEGQNKPKPLGLTLQQEEAERLRCVPADMSLLAISVLYYGQPRIVTRLSPAAFCPRPDVSSAVVRLDVYEQPIVEVPSDPLFFKGVRAGFGATRKPLKKCTAAGARLS